MRPPTYSDEQIIEAGQALAIDAPTRPVTAGAIRQRLGGGNLVRIRKVWTEHKAEQASTAHAQQDLPAEWVEALTPSLDHVRDELLGVMTQFHNQAAASAAQRVEEAIAQTQAAKAQNQQELADADAALEAADAEKEKAIAERDQMRQTLEAVENRLEEQKVTIGALEQALQDKETNLQAVHVELGDLREALGVARGDAEYAKASMREIQEQLARVRTERDESRESLAAAQAESNARRTAIEDLQSQLTVVTNERDQAHTRAADLGHDIEDLRAKLAVAEAELAAAAVNAKAFADAQAKVEEKLKGAEMRERAARDTAAELRGQLSVLEASAKPDDTSDGERQGRSR
jgi:chromosome segregation ATPase